MFSDLSFCLAIAGSLGCGIGYGYLHRIPIRVLPDDNKSGTHAKPYTGTTAAPLSVPYVPPLANTFASTNVTTVPMVPNTGKSDAEIVFGGVANLNLNNSTCGPASAAPCEHQHQQLPPTVPQQHQHHHHSHECTHTQSIEIGHAATEQPSITSNALPLAAPPQQQQQQPPPPPPSTSISSLNESFNIPSNPSTVLPPPSLSSPSSIYQTNSMQGK